MKKFRDDKRLLRGAFPKTTQEAKNSIQPITKVAKRRASTQFFAVAAHGNLSDHFKVLTPFGRSYTIKYAHLPHIVSEGEELMILLHDLQVLLVGRNLGVLEDHISNNELLWVRPSPSSKDDGTSNVFISEIQVRGSIHKLIGKLKNEEE